MLVISGGKIITMGPQGTLQSKIIIVEGDRIKAITEADDVPANAQHLDAGGGYILPGFIDAHAHIGLDEEIYRVEGDDVNETTDPVTPQLQAVDGIHFRDLAFQDALRGGITRVMSMPGSANVIGGQAVFLKTLAADMSGMIYKNPWGLKAALGENPKRVYGEQQKKAPRTRMASASLLREAFYKAARNLEKESLDPEIEYKQMPIFKVLRKEMPLLLHAHRSDDMLTALRLKEEFNIDIIIQHATEAVLIAGELRQQNVPVFIGPLLVNRAKVEMQEVAFKNARLLKERGVIFSLISDHPVTPIEHLRVSAALMVQEGLDEETALKAITLHPAQALKVDNELGSIEVGKRADLVAFDGHPFDFRSRVKWVVVDGQVWHNSDEH
ncbi:MAG: amidohydrolase [Syntrophomonadaceae bacterium]|jgi:imidazolonepropionase-like amidohydrolase|nr:amidohydrolase [Bacillota bacterium]HAA09932.1 amidohydrolase [Syntrophomonas sp.]HQA50985.1 amidohydrolase [Syntrophomonadaceae bacterium]HQD91476.1 amidohydrolase [Syntrophomonadaceae bacterium]